MVKRHYGVRDNRWKLIHFYDDIDWWELYDLEADPHELNNLYGIPEYIDEQRRMVEELHLLQRQYCDTLAWRKNSAI